MVEVFEVMESLRDLWRGHLKDATGITQTAIARRTGAVARFVPGGQAISAPYISQLLAPDGGKNPSPPAVGVLALAMESLYQADRGSFPAEARDYMDERFETVLGELSLRPKQWTAPDRPMMPTSENLILDKNTTDFVNRAMDSRSRPFAIGFTGPFRSGKTTLLGWAADRCQSQGLRVKSVSCAPIAVDNESDQDLFSRFANKMCLADKPTSAAELDVALERLLGEATSPTVLVLDEVNALVVAAERTETRPAGSTSASQLVRSVFTGWAAKQKTNPGAWSRLSLLIATTYTPDSLNAAALRSDIIRQYTICPAPMFTPGATLDLLELYAEHYGLPVTAAEASRVAEEICGWTGGHPYLTHDLVDCWVSARALGQPRSVSGDTPLLWGASAVTTRRQDAFLADVGRLLVVARDGGDAAVTPVGPTVGMPGAVQDVHVGVESLKNMGVVNTGDGEVRWASPFMQTHIPPLLRETGLDQDIKATDTAETRKESRRKHSIVSTPTRRQPAQTPASQKADHTRPSRWSRPQKIAVVSVISTIVVPVAIWVATSIQSQSQSKQSGPNPVVAQMWTHAASAEPGRQKAVVYVLVTNTGRSPIEISNVDPGVSDYVFASAAGCSNEPFTVQPGGTGTVVVVVAGGTFRVPVSLTTADGQTIDSDILGSYPSGAANNYLSAFAAIEDRCFSS